MLKSYGAEMCLLLAKLQKWRDVYPWDWKMHNSNLICTEAAARWRIAHCMFMNRNHYRDWGAYRPLTQNFLLSATHYTLQHLKVCVRRVHFMLYLICILFFLWSFLILFVEQATFVYLILSPDLLGVKNNGAVNTLLPPDAACESRNTPALTAAPQPKGPLPSLAAALITRAASIHVPNTSARANNKMLGRF